jgi:hypothetical protein
VVVNQDYVTPADFVKAIGDAGPHALRGDARPGALPTLRTMIDSGRRLVLLAENHAGAASWYQLAYERLLQETPFQFDSAAQLLAAGRRLPAQPRPASARCSSQPLGHHRPGAAAQRRRKVNAYAPLLARARACERIRKRLPNLLAVNFYKEGDVLPGGRHPQTASRP